MNILDGDSLAYSGGGSREFDPVSEEEAGGVCHLWPCYSKCGSGIASVLGSLLGTQAYFLFRHTDRISILTGSLETHIYINFDQSIPENVLIPPKCLLLPPVTLGLKMLIANKYRMRLNHGCFTFKLQIHPEGRIYEGKSVNGPELPQRRNLFLSMGKLYLKVRK